jgi:hypothetical protein
LQDYFCKETDDDKTMPDKFAVKNIRTS